MHELHLIPVETPDPNKRKDAYEVGHDIAAIHADITVHVPHGFQFDGASIPRPLWPLIGSPFHPRLMRAAVFHDWLYHTHQLGDRKRTDDMFRALLLGSGVGRIKTFLMFYAVRLFGWRYYKNDAEDIAYLGRVYHIITESVRNPLAYGLKTI